MIERTSVDLRQRIARPARLVADRVGGRAAIVLAVDVIDANRQVLDQLVLHADDRFARTRPIFGALVDDVAGRQRGRRLMNRELLDVGVPMSSLG